MRKVPIITGLDIGSSKVSAVTAEIDRNGLLRILAQGSRPSKGISRGTIVDLDEAVGSVQDVLTPIRSRTLNRLDDIYVNVSSQTMRGEKSKGMIPISLRGREIARADIDKCISVASTIRLAFDREVVHKFVQNFSIDDQTWIRNPEGLYASRLACEVYIVTANVNHIQNIYKCVNNAGYDVKGLVFTGVADGMSILDEKEMEEGTILLDIGNSLTEVAIFSGGALKDMEVIPFGAEDIKGNIEDDAALKDILSKVKNRMEGFLKSSNVVSITLTGGMAFIDGIVEVLESALSKPVKIGNARFIKGHISSLDSMRYATAIGLVRYAFENRKQKTFEETNLVKRLSTKVSDIFNNYF